MEKNISKLIQEKAQDILTEDTLQQIEEAFNQKVKLHVEAALVKQDDEYATKLEHLLEAIDIDHSKKLDKVLEAVDKNHAEKMIKVVKKYSKALTTEATEFKEDLVNKVSKFLDLYLEKLIPQEHINEAVKNKRAATMLSEMRKVLAVDAALQKDSIKDAILDGKAQIDESTQKLNEIEARVSTLSKENSKLKAQLTLENKCSGLSDDKVAFCKRVLKGKSSKFITENFDYTLKMFDKNHEEHLEVLHEQAKKQNTTRNIDRPATVITESRQQQNSRKSNGALDAYLSELTKY